MNKNEDNPIFFHPSAYLVYISEAYVFKVLQYCCFGMVKLQAATRLPQNAHVAPAVKSTSIFPTMRSASVNFLCNRGFYGK